MSPESAGYELKEGLENMDFAKVHAMLIESYWSPGISQENVEKAARNSTLVIGIFHLGKQVAYARIVSDKTTFGWVSDVIVDAAHQRKGLGRKLVLYALRHPEHQGFRRWVLKTRDAQGVYAACGFRPVPEPDKWMDYVPNADQDKLESK